VKENNSTYDKEKDCLLINVNEKSELALLVKKTRRLYRRAQDLSPGCRYQDRRHKKALGRATMMEQESIQATGTWARQRQKSARYLFFMTA